MKGRIRVADAIKRLGINDSYEIKAIFYGRLTWIMTEIFMCGLYGRLSICRFRLTLIRNMVKC